MPGPIPSLNEILYTAALPAVGDIVVRYLHTPGGAYSGAVTVLYQGVA